MQYIYLLKWLLHLHVLGLRFSIYTSVVFSGQFITAILFNLIFWTTGFGGTSVYRTSVYNHPN